MPDWSLIFLSVALVAAIFGFTGDTTVLGKLLSVLFLALFFASFLTSRDAKDKLL